MERKTAKYYREILASGNVSKSISLLPEILIKFGYEDKKWNKGVHNISLRDYTEFNWNHRIDEFSYNEKSKKVLVSIYWQGDSTDGHESEYATDLAYGKVIPADYYFDGYRTRCTHSDLQVSREEFADALKAIAKYLSPENIKARKIAQQRADLSTKVFEHIDAKKRSLGRWEMESFWNGRYGVQKVLEKEPELLNKSFDELKPIVDKVYANNCKSDYSLRGGYYSGEKKFNLSY